VLTLPGPRGGSRQPQRSLRQEYSEFILERIEDFKQQISREELLQIADEAVRELEAGAEEQLLLTEVLMLEHVDRLIIRRLNLPSYRRWRTRHLKLRRAQREPTHWGLDPRSAAVELVGSVAPDGPALVVGAAAAPYGLFLAAHDWSVTFVAADVAIVEGLETRASGEALSSRVDAFVVSLGYWMPDVRPALTVLDAGGLARSEPADREAFLQHVIAQTPIGGVHCLLPSVPGRDTITVGPETVKAYYAGWHLERIHDGAGRGLIATRLAGEDRLN
jgi:hypothetical protein